MHFAHLLYICIHNFQLLTLKCSQFFCLFMNKGTTFWNIRPQFEESAPPPTKNKTWLLLCIGGLWWTTFNLPLSITHITGVPGLLAIRVDRLTPLDGYVASKKVNDKKVIRDVRRHGDMYFNTGDLMMIDEDFYLYFKDRIGDTFRWAGGDKVILEYHEHLKGSAQGIEPGICGLAWRLRTMRANMIIKNPKL